MSFMPDCAADKTEVGFIKAGTLFCISVCTNQKIQFELLFGALKNSPPRSEALGNVPKMRIFSFTFTIGKPKIR